MKHYLIPLFLLIALASHAQEIEWSGKAGNHDFFDELNWRNINTNEPPSPNSIDANQPINFRLIISNVNAPIVANGIINLGSGFMNLQNVAISVPSISGGKITLNEDGYLDITSATPLLNDVKINFTSTNSWIRTPNYDGKEILAKHLNQISVNDEASIYESNLRLDNYYLSGTVIRSNNADGTPLTIFDSEVRQGSNAKIVVNKVLSGDEIPKNMDNKIASFYLKKGYMVTFAEESDGTGKSKNYIASENDLIIDMLPEYLVKNISFIRVLPWNWVTKKGHTTTSTELNNTWNYQWNNTLTSDVDREYAPMSWGAGGANDDADIELYKSKYKVTHVMAFNESDNCSGQSGQYSNLCKTDVAVGYYKNLMKTGLRLVSPSCRENAPFGWLKEFYDKASQQDIRIDVIGVHWYDWGSNPTNSPNADPVVVFNRFKKYLQDVHDLYQLPIWITEFNANPNRSGATNFGFMQLALPYLESLDYVERYCWFQPNSGVANFFDASGKILTPVGELYKNTNSTASIPKATVSGNNNLDFYYNVNTAIINDIIPDQIIVFPNPSSGRFEFSGIGNIHSLQIFDLQGRLIFKKSHNYYSTLAVDLSAEKPGIYLAISSNQYGATRYHKLIISR